MIHYRDADGRHLSIPDYRQMDRSLLHRLIRQAGMTPEEFVQLRRRRRS